MPVVRSIVREAARNDYRFSSVVMGIVESTPFVMRRVSPDESGTVTASAGSTTASASASESPATSTLAQFTAR
jgi:hypothetical protein